MTVLLFELLVSLAMTKGKAEESLPGKTIKKLMSFLGNDKKN